MHLMESMDAVTAHHVPISAATLVKRADTPAAVILMAPALMASALAAFCMTPTVVTATAHAPTPTGYFATDTEL